MKVDRSMVTKLMITDVPNLDPVAVFLEDYRPGWVKITIECYGQAWSHFWGGKGEKSGTEFFCGCDNHYLCGKLAPGLKSTIIDDDRLEVFAKRTVIRRRREDGCTKAEARELYDKAKTIDRSDAELMYDVFGDEWWEQGPKVPNYRWEYLCRILDAAKAGVATLKTAN